MAEYGAIGDFSGRYFVSSLSRPRTIPTCIVRISSC